MEHTKRSAESVSTQQLIEAARGGNRAAFDEITRRFAPRLEQAIRARLSTESDLRLETEDVVQETLFSAWRDLHTFRWINEKAFWFWLEAVARHLIQGAIRKHRATKRAHREISLARPIGEQACRDPADAGRVEDSLEADTPTPSGVYRRAERFNRLRLAMENLNADHRRIVFLTQLYGVSVTEVARRMGRSRPAVSMTLLRALRQIRGSFGATDSLHLGKGASLYFSAWFKTG